MIVRNSKDRLISPTTRQRHTARRAAYSLAAGAVAVAAGGSGSEAAVVYSGLRDTSIGQGLLQAIDLDNDTQQDIYLKNYIFNQGNYQGATVEFAPGKLVGFKSGTIYYATALAAGGAINEAALSPKFFGSLAYGNINPNAQFKNVTNAYVGFDFPSGANTYYGWVRVDVNNAAGTFLIHDWAYENVSGSGISAGYRGVPGDYNHDGVVDQNDYETWREDFGESAPAGADADGNANGVVDAADYVVWRDHLGQTQSPAPGAGVGTSNSVPEPATLGLLAAGSAGIVALRKLRRESRNAD